MRPVPPCRPGDPRNAAGFEALALFSSGTCPCYLGGGAENEGHDRYRYLIYTLLSFNLDYDMGNSGGCYPSTSTYGPPEKNYISCNFYQWRYGYPCSGKSIRIGRQDLLVSAFLQLHHDTFHLPKHTETLTASDYMLAEIVQSICTNS